MEKIYNRFTKSKKEITVQDLQKEIKDTKTEMRNLKQELTILRVANGGKLQYNRGMAEGV